MKLELIEALDLLMISKKIYGDINDYKADEDLTEGYRGFRIGQLMTVAHHVLEERTPRGKLVDEAFEAYHALEARGEGYLVPRDEVISVVLSATRKVA